MSFNYPDCWAVKNCGRQKGGPKESELGECVCSQERLGHSCWVLPGTLCGGVVQGTEAQKEAVCKICSVYKDYNRITGKKRREVKAFFPGEERKYNQLVFAKHAEVKIA
jgi:hypothetical protein